MLEPGCNLTQDQVYAWGSKGEQGTPQKSSSHKMKPFNLPLFKKKWHLRPARTPKGMKSAACVRPNRGNVNGARSTPPPAFAFTFPIIYCSFKAARHPQPETHNCHAGRSFTRRSPGCHVLMGQSRAQHKGITNTYGSSAGEGGADGSLTRPGRRRLITLPASGIAISQEDVRGGDVFKCAGVGLELSGIRRCRRGGWKH